MYLWSIMEQLCCRSLFNKPIFFMHGSLLLLRDWLKHLDLICLHSELGSNPLSGAGIEAGAFSDLKRVSYIRISDTEISAIPKGAAALHVHTENTWVWCHLSITSLIPKAAEQNPCH